MPAENQRNSLYITPESVFGETPTTPTWEKIANTGDSITMNREVQASQEKRADRQRTCMQAGVKSVGGDINAEFKADAHDTLWEAWFQSSFVTDGGGAGIDELKVGTTAPSFTALAVQEDLVSGQYSIYRGCQVNTFSLTVSPTTQLPLTFGILGKDMEQTSTEIAGSTYGVLGENCPITGFVGVIKENDITVGYITEISLNGENGMQAQQVAFADSANSISSSKSIINGSIAFIWEDNVIIDKFLNDTNSSIEFELYDDVDKYIFKLPNITYTSGLPDRSQTEGNMIITANFEASYDSTEGTQIVLQKTTV